MADYAVAFARSARKELQNLEPQVARRIIRQIEALVTDPRPSGEWRLAPGAETGWHRHAHDYVVVCLTSGKLLAETAQGNVETALAFGQAYARPAGVEHNIVNPGADEFRFIEVELKTP